MSDLVATLRAEARGWRMVRPTDVRTATMLDEAADRIEELETRYADKSADVAQLIGLLEKAEARYAELERANVNPDTQHGDGPLRAGSSVTYAGSTHFRTSGETK